MLTITDYGDTPASVAFRILGSSDESYAKKIWDVNRHSLARTMNNHNGTFCGNRAVWLPGFGNQEESNSNWVRYVIHCTEFIPSDGRATLLKLQKSGVDINHLTGMSKGIIESNRRNRGYGAAIIASASAKVGFESAVRVVERVSYPAEKFSETVNEMNHHLARIMTLREQSYSVRNAEDALNIQFKTKMVRGWLRDEAKELGKRLDTVAKFHADRISPSMRRYLSNPKMMEAAAKRKGIFINDTEDVARLEDIALYGKWIGRGCLAFSIILGIDDVYNTYEEGGDTWGEAGTVTGEILGCAIVGGFLLGLIATPVGWVACISLAVTEGLAMSGAGYGVGTKFHEFGDWAHRKFDWCSRHLRHWL